MDNLTVKSMKPLIEHDTYPSISIFLPTHSTGSQTRQDPIRFKNLVTDCEQKLKLKFPTEAARKILKPACDMLQDNSFWRYQSRGLALFMADHFVRHFRLSTAPQETARVDTYFYVVPLVADLMHDQPYYLLDLNLKDVKLLKICRDRIDPVEVPDLPTSIEAYLPYEELEKQPQFRTVPEGKIDGADAIFHGQGSMADDDRRKRIINDYIVKIAKGIEHWLAGTNAPLILAGDEYDKAFYRRHSHYPYLLEKSISRYSGPSAMAMIQHKAEQIIRAHFQQVIEDAVNRYREFEGTGKVSGDILQVLPAAFTGRIDTLLVNPDMSVYGRFHPQSHRVQLAEDEQYKQGDEELINLTVLHALRHGTQVYPAAGDAINTPVAALFRY